MSIAALTVAARNSLRTNLTNFYDVSIIDPDYVVKQANRRAANCRVMPNHFPAANAGDEFIAIYGGNHRPRETFDLAIEEEFGFEVAISLKVPAIPRDARGELGYVFDADQYALGQKSIEARCREVVKLFTKNYTFMQACNALFDNENGFSEPLSWSMSDAIPTEVGAEHFCAYHAAINPLGGNDVLGLPGIPQAENVYGLLMHVRFGGAIRFQPLAEYDLPGP